MITNTRSVSSVADPFRVWGVLPGGSATGIATPSLPS
jgi:hypothetical protein